MNKALFSSDKMTWETPQDFFDELNKEFNFTLDPCATAENAKCKKYFTKEDDGLAQDWEGETVFCNPPYGREIGRWVKKCYDESRKEDTICVMLIPARTDTKWFHQYIYQTTAEIRFIKGRLKFGNATNSAPFPSMVVVYDIQSPKEIYIKQEIMKKAEKAYCKKCVEYPCGLIIRHGSLCMQAEMFLNELSKEL